MKTILVVCSNSWDHYELKKAQKRTNHEYNVLYHYFYTKNWDKINKQLASNKTTIKNMLDDIVQQYEKVTIDAVINSSDHPGTSFTPLLARQLGLVGSDPEKIIRCQHKYYARLDQQRLVPEAVPWFTQVNPTELSQYSSLDYPCFVKPIKSALSIGATAINNYTKLRQHIATGKHLPQIDLFTYLMQSYVPKLPHIPADHYIAEQHLHGRQITIEGFINNHEITIIGIVDSVMLPGSISFKSFEYPSNLDIDIQERIVSITKTYLHGLGLNNLLFNVEYIYNEEHDSLHIIEINPRLVYQFADLYEKVDGVNTYDLLIDLALGNKPRYYKKRGRYRHAASCVLRCLQNQYVEQTPTEKALEKLYTHFPKSRFELCCVQGKKLSDVFQDSYSYRYGLVHLGGNSREEIEEHFQESQKILDFVLKPV